MPGRSWKRTSGVANTFEKIDNKANPGFLMTLFDFLLKLQPGFCFAYI